MFFAGVGSAVAAVAVRSEHSPADAAVGRRAMGGDHGAALRVRPRLSSRGSEVPQTNTAGDGVARFCTSARMRHIAEPSRLIEYRSCHFRGGAGFLEASRAG